jgi:hypothetical protein
MSDCVFFRANGKRACAAGGIVLDGCEHHGEGNDAKVKPVPDSVLQHETRTVRELGWQDRLILRITFSTHQLDIVSTSAARKGLHDRWLSEFQDQGKCHPGGVM